MNAPRGDPIGRSAEVVAGGCRIRYVRRGSGRPVVVLGVAELAAPFPAELRDALAARFRVLEPDAFTRDRDSGGEQLQWSDADGGGSPSFETELRWLVPFLEGLGLLGVGVVVGGRFGAAADRLVVEAPEHVSGVVVLHWSAANGVGHGTSDGAGPRAHGPVGGAGPHAHGPAAGERPRGHGCAAGCTAAPGGTGRILRVNAGDPDLPALLGCIVGFLSDALASPGA